jgi:hypothetical protein
MDRYNRGGTKPPLPELTKNDYILDLLFDIGLAKSGGMGAVPIDWVDIKSYMDCTGTKLNYYETKKIRELSKVYVSQLNSSKDESTPPPFTNSSTGLHLFANLKRKKKQQA